MRKLAMNAAVSLVVMGLGAGCAPVPTSVETDEQQTAAVLDKLSGYVEVAVNAQRELAMTADAKAQNAMARRQRLLTDVVSYDFYGDIETILNDIANKYDYKLDVFGKRPAGNVVVNVYVQKKPVLDVLKYIGYSTPFFDIKLGQGVIELHYKG